MIRVAQARQDWRGKSFGLLPTDFVESAFLIKQKPFSFGERRYLLQPYNTGSHRLLLKFARQSEKSTMIGNRMITYGCMIPEFRMLYVSPSLQQTQEFSKDRLRLPLETCPMLQAYTDTRMARSVLSKQFINQSTITLRYAFHTPDRARGIMADFIAIDEFQDIILDHVPVIEECASHSEHKLFLYAGTPKSLDNSIEQRWQRDSTQCEWVVPCFRHQVSTNGVKHLVPHWNILGEKNIGKTGPVCDQCGSAIYPDHPDAHWRALRPNPDVPKPTEGYHISQLMVPWIWKDPGPEGWGDILHKQKTYSRAMFYNEVLGLSFDSGIRPLSQEDVRACCVPEGDPDSRLFDMSETALQYWEQYCRSNPCYIGFDWGGGEKAYTVAFLATYWKDRFTVFYAKRFEGEESAEDPQVHAAAHLIQRFSCILVGTDFGAGLEKNDKLVRIFGPKKIVRYQYVGFTGKICVWDNVEQRFKGNRTAMLSATFNTIKRQEFRFPLWRVFREPFAADFLNVFAEYNERRRMTTYDHLIGTTDDSLHSLTICFFVSMLHRPRADVLAPGR